MRNIFIYYHHAFYHPCTLPHTFHFERKCKIKKEGVSIKIILVYDMWINDKDLI